MKKVKRSAKSLLAAAPLYQKPYPVRANLQSNANRESCLHAVRSLRGAQTLTPLVRIVVAVFLKSPIRTKARDSIPLVPSRLLSGEYSYLRPRGWPFADAEFRDKSLSPTQSAVGIYEAHPRFSHKQGYISTTEYHDFIYSGSGRNAADFLAAHAVPPKRPLIHSILVGKHNDRTGAYSYAPREPMETGKW